MQNFSKAKEKEKAFAFSQYPARCRISMHSLVNFSSSDIIALTINIPHSPFFFRLCIQYAKFPAQKNAAPKALLQNYNRIEVLFPFFLIASIR